MVNNTLINLKSWYKSTKQKLVQKYKEFSKYQMKTLTLQQTLSIEGYARDSEDGIWNLLSDYRNE